MSLLRVLARPARRCAAASTRSYAAKAPASKKPAANAPKAAATPAAKSAATKGAPAAGEPLSSAPENMVLPGLNWLKGQPEVQALPDAEYPPWLWTILKPRVYTDDGPGSEAERVRRRQENRQRIRDANFMKTQ